MPVFMNYGFFPLEKRGGMTKALDGLLVEMDSKLRHLGMTKKEKSEILNVLVCSPLEQY